MLNNLNMFHFVTICCCWLTLLDLSARLCCVQAISIPKNHINDNDIRHDERNDNRSGNAPQQSDGTVRNFSPRLDYNNEWRPVGRGDPLKNDPTYDYSPPALERVRYWRADNESKGETNQPKYTKTESSVHGKKEILLLGGGMPNERQRGQLVHHSESSIYHQPKYPLIRRSYYAHQHHLPTHLMPPPMQTIAPSMNSMKSNIAVEYRNGGMPSSPTATTTSTSTMTTMMHSKPYYSTSVTSPWMHTSMSSASSAAMMGHYKPYPNTPKMRDDHHDHHPQESINQFSYTRPNMGTSYTANNFIDTANQSSLKPRKPWLHQLLQKEVVKVPSNAPVHKYSMNSEKIFPEMGISTTHPPVEFVPLPATTTTTTPKPQPTASPTTHLYTTTSPVYFTTTMAMATMPTTRTTPFMNTIATPITTSNRLLIPTTSNLMHRPTVTPMEMTTDALFKHYKQPSRPLLGPMYLIIEGHSKVKTYGKDELDPHKPKIVPVISKREPVVRIGNPNETQRGTLETFTVKHLHTKPTTPIGETPQSIEKGKMTATTTAPTTPSKPAITNPPKSVNTTKVVISIKNLSTTTTKATPKADEKQPTNETETNQLQMKETSTGMEGFFDFLDTSLDALFKEAPMVSEIKESDQMTTPKDSLVFVTTPSTLTILHPIDTTTAKSTQIEARIDDDDHDDYDENVDKVTTEPGPRDVRQIFDYDQLPESRIQDRMDVNYDENNNDDDDDDDDDDDESESDHADNDKDDHDVEADENYEGVISLLDDSVEENIENLSAEDNHELIKRIDKLVDGIDDDENADTDFDELLTTEDDNDDDDDDILSESLTKEA